jgi:hypothetical protein
MEMQDSSDDVSAADWTLPYILAAVPQSSDYPAKGVGQ